MSTDRWARLRHLFDTVCDLPDEERRRRLELLCDDAGLRAEVEALVAAQTVEFRRGAQPMGRMLDQLVETELREGDRLDAWHLLAPMGSGGMGAVFQAERRDGQFEQRAAIKLLRGLPSRHSQEQMARERQILARLEHPGIARLYDGGATPGGQPYLVMEYIEGERIDQWCRDRALGLRQRLILLLQVADALAYAHRRLILHCDLKPSNVMVRDGGQPVLLDFGVARLIDQPGSEAGAALTPGYAAPEQLRGEVAGVASDVYGFGRLLGELVLDRRLTGDETQPPLRVARLAYADLPWRAGLRGDLDLMIATATAEDPARRYPTIEAMAADIRHWLDRKPLTLRGRAPLYRFGKFVSRRLPLLAGASIVVLAVCVAAWRVLDEGRRALEAERVAVTEARAAEGIATFLVSLFESANPGNHGGNEPGLRQVLDAGAARLLEAEDLQDASRARLARTLATVYGAMGLPEREAELLELGMSLYGSAGAAQAERIEILSELTVAEANRARFDTAEAHLQEARRLLRHVPEPSDLLIADLANSEGLLRSAQRRLDEAEALLRESLALRRNSPDAKPTSVAAVLHNLGLLELERHQPLAAIAHFEEALAIKRAAVGVRHPSYLLSLESLGRSWRDSGDSARALEILEQATELRLAIHGERSIGTQRAFNELGAALHDAARMEEAEHAFMRAMSIAAEVAGERSFVVAVVMNNLAYCLEDMGRMDEAESLYRRSLELREALLPENDTRILRVRSNLGWLLLADGRAQEARPLLSGALAGYRSVHPHLVVEQVQLELRMAALALTEGDVGDAQARLERAKAMEPEFGRRNLELGLRVQAGIALATGQADALVLAETALDARRTRLGSGHPGQLPWLFDAIDAARAGGVTERAAELLREASALVETTQAGNAPSRTRLAGYARTTRSPARR